MTEPASGRARWLGGHRITLASCGSTNDEAAALARSGAPHGTVVIAAAQTMGRGRQGRRWYSPPGANLYLSMVLRPALPPRRVPPITLAVGVAVCEAVNAAGVAASLKWPNDVTVGGRKLAGILTEMSTRGHGDATRDEPVLDHVIVGIGVDLDLPPAEIPAEVAAVATSIAAERGGRAVDHAAFTEALLDACERWIDRFLGGGVAAIAAAWTERAALAGTVRAGAVTGVPVGLDDSGALRLRDADGVEHRVVAGDVEAIEPRPAGGARS